MNSTLSLVWLSFQNEGGAKKWVGSDQNYNAEKVEVSKVAGYLQKPVSSNQS